MRVKVFEVFTQLVYIRETLILWRMPCPIVTLVSIIQEKLVVTLL